MKIFAIGRNYAEHAKELGNEIPDAPVIFMKPDTALLGVGEPFVYPEFSSDIHYEVEVVLRVSKPGKRVAIDDAAAYYDAISIGIDFTARDLQSKCKAKGLPWEIAKSFDGSASIGEFVPVPAESDYDFSLQINGEVKQAGNSRDMLHGCNSVIHHVSQYFTLSPGDLIYTGTPAGVGPVHRGDLLEGYLGETKLMNCVIQ
jgi:2-keto-4-pentenoate hydratase/2-oxohepta-3-ene-1,7-dioic acid hydratase in catechol pathway